MGDGCVEFGEEGLGDGMFAFGEGFSLGANGLHIWCCVDWLDCLFLGWTAERSLLLWTGGGTFVAFITAVF